MLQNGPSTRPQHPLYTHSMKLLLYIAVLSLIPVCMGVISSYRAGQKPHRHVYLILKKFAQRKNK